MDIILFWLIVENFITIRNFFNFYYCVNIESYCYFDASPSYSYIVLPIDFHISRRFHEPINISDMPALCTPSFFPLPDIGSHKHIYMHWLHSNLYSLSLSLSLWFQLLIQTTPHLSIASGWLNIGYRQHVWGARRGKGDRCYQVVVACSYNSHRVIRLKWCSREGLKHHEKPISRVHFAEADSNREV